MACSAAHIGRRSHGAPLSWAARRENLAKLRRTLIYVGPSCLNACGPDFLKRPALHVAIQANALRSAALLLDLGASPTVRCGNRFQTPIYYARTREAVELLVARGARIDTDGTEHMCVNSPVVSTQLLCVLSHVPQVASVSPLVPITIAGSGGGATEGRRRPQLYGQ